MADKPNTLVTRFVDRFIRQNPVRIFWIYRSFIWRAAISDLRFRYVGSVVGVFWNVLMPLAQILIYTAVFSQIMPLRMPGIEMKHAFTIYLCSGLLPWIGFSECISRGTQCFLENANYLKKLPIPEQVFVAQNAVSATISLGMSMILLLIVTMPLGGGVTSAWVGIPVVILLLQAVGFGFGLSLGSINVFFRDIGQALTLVLQLWMWLTPVVYNKEILPPTLRGCLKFNPAYPFIDALQGIVLRKSWPSSGHWGMMILWALIVPLAGYFILRKLRPEIRDAL